MISIILVVFIELKPLIISASHSNWTSAIDDLLVTGIVEQGEPVLLVVYLSISVELLLLSIFDMDDIHKSFFQSWFISINSFLNFFPKLIQIVIDVFFFQKWFKSNYSCIYLFFPKLIQIDQVIDALYHSSKAESDRSSPCIFPVFKSWYRSNKSLLYFSFLPRLIQIDQVIVVFFFYSKAGSDR